MTPEQDAQPSIWLEPACAECAREEGRMWCEDDAWSGGCEDCGAPSPKYIRADAAPRGTSFAHVARIAELEEALREAIQVVRILEASNVEIGATELSELLDRIDSLLSKEGER